MAAYTASAKRYASIDERDARNALIEQLRRGHCELSELLALATLTPPDDSYDAAWSCLRADANALARTFLLLSESLLACADDPADSAVVSVPND